MAYEDVMKNQLLRHEPPVRRKYDVEGCTRCSLRFDGPYHDPSSNCGSGKHPHCSCDLCF